MKTTIKATLFLSVFVLSVLSLSTTGVAASPTLNTVPFLPNRSSLDDFLGKSAYILDNAIPANIPGTNVYYYSYNVTNSVSQTIISSDGPSSINFSLNGEGNSTLRLKYLVINLDSNLTAILTDINAMRGGAIYSFTPTGTGSWIDVTWKVEIIKEWYAIEKVAHPSLDLTSTANFQAYLNNIDANLSAKGLGAFGSFSTMTPELVMAVTNQMIKPVQSFTSLQYAYQADNKKPDVTGFTIFDVINWAQPIVHAANTEIGSKTSLTLDYADNINLSETINDKDIAVVIIWDNDNSLMRFIGDLKAGKIPNFQPFSGDEVFYLMHFNTMTETYTGSMLKNATWTYNDHTTPVALGKFIRMIAVRPEIADLLGRAAGDNRIGLIRELLFGNIDAPSINKQITQTSFSLSQLKVDKLTLSYSRETGIDAKQVNMWFEEHKWAGLVAFDDLDHNGIMNLGVNGTYPFLYPVSNEARYRFDITNVNDLDFSAPTVADNGVNFGLTFNGITGKMVPYDVDADTATFNNTVTGELNETVPSIAFNFRFTVNSSANEGRMKTSYDIGQFNNATGQLDPALTGLSLSMVTTLDVLHYMHGTRVFNGSTLLSDENGGNVSANGNRVINKIRFGSGSSLQNTEFQTDLASIPYTTGGTSYTAYGQMIPVMVGGISYGRTTAVGNLTRQTQTALVGGVFLYSVNFPTWSGHEVMHDPVFSTFITSSNSNNPLTWVIVGVTIGGIAALVVIFGIVHARKKRSSSFPGSPGAAGEAKDRAGTQRTRIGLIHSLFFHFDANDVQVGEQDVKLQSYDPTTFEFFSALTTVTVNEMEPADGSWSRLSGVNMDVEGTGAATDIALVLGSELTLTKDKFDLPVNVGRAYSYRVETSSGYTFFLLDIFTRPSIDATFRISMCSKAQLTGPAMQHVEIALRNLSVGFQQLLRGKFKPDLIEQLITRYLPIQLAMPRHATPGEIIDFSRQIRSDDQLMPTDVAEIETDLKTMDDDMSRRVVTTFKDTAANLDDESEKSDDETEAER
ncbi:MAG TPA: hypothetical protein VKM55_25440 [Candidatus Lokiarchaeia archaeon]|nr:hypothetical protein [Candidatus Lokiarchaeia archaeon]